MNTHFARFHLRRALLPAVTLVLAGAILLWARTPSAEAAPAADTASSNVVLSGSYYCQVFNYTYVIPPVDPDSPPTTGTYREMSHGISISGTGGITAIQGNGAPGVGAGIGPAFGGRPSVPQSFAIPSGLGSGVGMTFPDGSVEDCQRFADAVAAAARQTACALSVTQRTDYPAAFGNGQAVRFSFVCEGTLADEVRVIGVLDRAALAQRIGSGT